MKKVIAIGVSVLVAMTAFAASKDAAGKKIKVSPTQVLGTVNGENFYMRDWNVEFASLSEKMKIQGSEVLFMPIQGAIVNKMAMSKQAVASGLDKTDTYKAEMSKAKRDILTTLYLADKINTVVSDKEAKEEYKTYKKAFKVSKQLSVSHILLKTRNDADVIIKALKSGQDFNDLAKKKSIGAYASTGGKLGFISSDKMVPAFEKAAFKLKDGQYTLRPVKTQYGWHVIKREATRDLKPEPYEEIVNIVKQSVYQKRLAKLILDVTKEQEIVLYDLKGNVIK